MSNMILIGYMGCGKSTVGRRLSYRLRQPYVDTDNLIEIKAKMSISDIFAQQGEESFREMETECLKSMFDYKQDYVIAVGGGLPMREVNREIMKELGTIIYLRATPDTIYERVKDDTKRPLLQGEDPRGKISTMIGQRGPVYEAAADYIIDVDGKSFEEIMAEIEEVVSK